MDVLGDKLFVSEKCWRETNQKSTAEEWILRMRSVFPYADRVARVQYVVLHQPTVVSVYFIPVPQDTTKLSGKVVKTKLGFFIFFIIFCLFHL